MGLGTQAFAASLISDMKLMGDFWSLVENLLNTVLFALGGLVWGSVIANSDDRLGTFNGTDWGYLFLLYVLLTAIRFFLFAVVYPLTVRIGLKSCWQEYVFQSFGGLRGAVGISLAIAIDNTVRDAVISSGYTLDDVYVLQTNKLFGMVGGIAFLSLVINATFAGPILKKLGLADSTLVREQVIKTYRSTYNGIILKELIFLLAQERFEHVNFAVVREHVYELKAVTREEFLKAVDEYRAANSHKPNYREPSTTYILPYLTDNAEADVEHGAPQNDDVKASVASQASGGAYGKEKIELLDKFLSMPHDEDDSARAGAANAPNKLNGPDSPNPSGVELRQIFLHVVHGSYTRQLVLGELTKREFLTFVLEQSLEMANDAVGKGGPINDWSYVQLLHIPFTKKLKLHATKLQKCFKACCPKRNTGIARDVEFAQMRFALEASMAFMRAHERARKTFAEQFQNGVFCDEGKKVVQESLDESQKALDCFNKYPREAQELIASHKLCSILVNNSARHVTKLSERGLLKETEAQGILENLDEALHHIAVCEKYEHKGEIRQEEADAIMGKEVEVEAEQETAN
jgi:hypothetical protein